MKKFIKFFVRGLIFITPIGVTTLLIISAFEWLTDKIEQVNLHWIVLLIVVITSIVGLTLIGYLGSNLFMKPIAKFIEGLIRRIPLVNFIYSSLKDVVNALMGEKRKFDKPVLVNLYGNELYKPGFITQEDLTKIGLEGKVAVYLPHSYALSGNVYIVDQKCVTIVDIPSSDMMKLIVSGGVAMNDIIRKLEERESKRKKEEQDVN